MNLSDRNANRPKNIYNTNNTNKNANNIIHKQSINVTNNKDKYMKQNQNDRNNSKFNNQKKEIVFKVKPDIQNDIYHLYTLNDKGDEVYFDIAYIPDFTTSVMMNKLFRNIKENDNLDALEESDDEEEFENEKEDRFVYLDKSYYMICQYNYKFKKWYPLRISNERNIANINDVKK